MNNSGIITGEPAVFGPVTLVKKILLNLNYYYFNLAKLSLYVYFAFESCASLLSLSLTETSA